MDLKIITEKATADETVSILRVEGYLDTTTSIQLEETLEKMLRENHFRIIIDLDKVDYISSAGWGIFIGEIKTIRKMKGDLKLANLIPEVYDIYKLLEFDNIIKAYDSIDEAVKDFPSV